MSTITTDWKSPQSVAQDSTYKKINGGTCYPFYNLANVKKNDTSYAYQSYYSNGKWHAGTHKNRASPIVYAYNYGFNVPSKATIKSVELQYVVMQGSYPSRKNLRTNVLKLKTTASTTDSGGSSPNYLKSSEQMWNVRTKDWSYFTRTISASECHVTLTPNIVNSSNFGFIIQAIGTRSSNLGNTPAGGWDDAWIAKMRIRVTYENPEYAVEDTTSSATFKMSAYIKDTDVKQLSMDYPDSGTNLVIQLEHQSVNGTYFSGKTPVITLSGNNNQYLFSSKKQTEYTVQTMNVASGSKPDNKSSTIEVYPYLADKSGVTSVIQVRTSEDSVSPQSIDVALPVSPWTGYNNKAEYDDVSNSFIADESMQGCIIKDNTFNGCSAKYGGGYYCSEEQEFITRSYNESQVDGQGYAIHPNWDKVYTQSLVIGSNTFSGSYVVPDDMKDLPEGKTIDDYGLEWPYTDEGFHVEDDEGHDATQYFYLYKKLYIPHKKYYRWKIKWDFNEQQWASVNDSDYNEEKATNGKYRSGFSEKFYVTYYGMSRYIRNVVAVGDNVHKNMPRSSESHQKGCLQDYDYINDKYSYKDIDD